jgi:hypothetical protein
MALNMRLAFCTVSALIALSAEGLLQALPRAASLTRGRHIPRRGVGMFASAIRAPVDVLGDGGVVKVWEPIYRSVPWCYSWALLTMRLFFLFVITQGAEPPRLGRRLDRRVGGSRPVPRIGG